MQLTDRLAGAACSLPTLPLPEVFAVFNELGIRKFEAYSEWSAARIDCDGDPEDTKSLARQYGTRITSFHLPSIGEDVEGGVERAMRAARFAAAVGANIVLLKGASKEIYGRVAGLILDMIDAEALPLTVVLQNHVGGAIETLADYDEVFRAVSDSRLKCVLEVGHFQRKGIGWETAWNELAERTALIHINDNKQGHGVPYGDGDVDFPGLMRRIKDSGYDGDIVLELELEDRKTNPAASIAGLRQAVQFLEECYQA